VGDVVTVPSPLGPLPVTHRVIATEQLADGTTRLRLRGDANDSEDPFPYDVTEVRRVIVSAPGVGYALVRLGEPKVMGSVTVGIALLVGWALWPRERERSGERRRRRDRRVAASAPIPAPVDEQDLDRSPDPDTTALDPRPGEDLPAPAPAPAQQAAPPARRRRATTGVAPGVLLLAASATALTLGTLALATAPPAAAAPPAPAAVTPPPDGFTADRAEPRSDGVLELSSSLPMGEQWLLSPGSDLRWRVESAIRPPGGAAAATGSVWVSLVASGPLLEADGAVRISLELCDGGWAADDSCPSGLRTVDAPATDGAAELDRVPVGRVTSQDPQAVVVRMQVPANLGDENQGLGMTLGLRFDAFGEETYLSEVLAAVDNEGAGGYQSDVLGVTGADLRPAAWAVLALLLGSIALVWASDRRRYRAALAEARRRETDDPGSDGPDAREREEVVSGARAP
jgi:hypothetical protein